MSVCQILRPFIASLALLYEEYVIAVPDAIVCRGSHRTHVTNIRDNLSLSCCLVPATPWSEAANLVHTCASVFLYATATSDILLPPGRFYPSRVYVGIQIA